VDIEHIHASCEHTWIEKCSILEDDGDG